MGNFLQSDSAFGLYEEHLSWCQKIETELQGVTENLKGFNGSEQPGLKEGLLVVERALRQGVMALQIMHRTKH
jgi:hypothetical protein